MIAFRREWMLFVLETVQRRRVSRGQILDGAAEEP